MPKLYDRRDFLQVAASMLAAPALLSNQSVIASQEKPAALTPPPPLEVLYDTLGNATDGWGWAGQGGYTSTFSNTLALNYNVVTCYIGTLPTAKRLRGFECAVNALNFQSQMYMPPSYFLGRFYLGIWRTDVGTFYQDPLGGSLTRLTPNTLGNPNVGSASTPVGTVGDAQVYHIGWDNLDVMLPANVQIQMSFYAEGIQLGDALGIWGSSRPGSNMLRARSEGSNSTIGQPMATRITVSDLGVTAASADIFGRVVNKSGRGINGARVTLLDTQNNRTTTTISNPFGYFRFTGLPTGDFYVLSAKSKRYTFGQSPQAFQLLGDVTDLRIVAD